MAHKINQILTRMLILATKENLNLITFLTLEEIDDGDIITNSQDSDKLRHALIDSCFVNRKLSITSPLPNFTPQTNFTKGQKPVLDTKSTHNFNKFLAES